MGLELVQKRSKNGNFSSKIEGTSLYHCEDGPAMKSADEEIYCILGVPHRIGDPAESSGDGYLAWYFMGQPHRLGGPSSHYKGSSGHRYSVFGQHMTAATYKKLMANKPLVEHLKQVEKAMDLAFRTGQAPIISIQAAKTAKAAAEPISLFPFMAALGAVGLGTAVAGAHLRKKAKLAAIKQETVVSR